MLSQARHPAWHLALIALAVAACYANGLNGQFVLDDDLWISGSAAKIASWSSIVEDPPSRRVAYLTFRLNHHLHGLDPFGFHLVNVAIHLLAAFAVYALGKRLLALASLGVRAGGGAGGGKPADDPTVAGPALAGALLFAVHPLQTQAVTYVVQRITSLAALFYLSALVLYVVARKASCSPARRRLAYGGAFFSALLGMWTKEIVFTLPLALLLLELAFFAGPLSKRARAIAPFLALAPAIPLVTVRAYGSLRAARAEGAFELPSRLDYLATQAKVVVAYLRLFVLPVNQSVLHDVPVEHGFGSARVIFSALLLCALFTFGALLLWKGRAELRVAGFGIVLFFLALSVESSVVPIADVMNEHRVYLPSAGLALALAGFFFAAVERWPAMGRRLAAAMAACAVALGAATVARNRAWRNDISLWTDAARKSPALGRAHYALGAKLFRAGRPAEARQEIETAIHLDPLRGEAHLLLARFLAHDGDLGGARAQYSEVIRLEPKNSEAMFELAELLRGMREYGEASRLYSKVALTALSDDSLRSSASRWAAITANLAR